MRSVRSPFLGLLLATLLSGLTPALEKAHAGLPPDSTGILTPWRIEPANPCFVDSVSMIVRGFVATPCDSFIDAQAISPLFVRIRRAEYVDRRCLAPPSVFFPVPVPLGRFQPGTHTGIVEVVTLQLRNDGSTTTLAQQFRFGFEVAVDCSLPPPPPPPGPLPYVHTIGTEPQRPCAGRPTSLVLAGEFPNGCGQVIDAFVWDPHNVSITVKPWALRDTVCTPAPLPWRQDFNLGPLPSGPHRTNITVVVVAVDSTGTGFTREFYYSSHEFFVYGDCDSIPPPPPPGPLPYVDRILVGRQGICRVLPPCPGDSILVQVSGVFPSDCFSFRRIELIPSPLDIFPPPPPTVRIIVENGCCYGRPCGPSPIAWSAVAKLPPMKGGDYHLDVELAEVCCSSTYPPGDLYATQISFWVADTCPPPPPCLTVDFAPGPGNFIVCNATVGFGRPAELTVLVHPTVALAGLQGELKLDPPALQITGIVPIGPAEGMFIDWTPTAEGARFVLFAKSGAPIPPIDAGTPGWGWPVLRVTVEFLRRGGEPPARTVVTTENILGSDIEGGAVPLCPLEPCPFRDPTYPLGQAVICSERVCDFNFDGLQDVRDLVLMVHCVNGEGACPPDAATHFDCNGDGTFALADVICCAGHVLQRSPCLGCPPDTGQVRPAPGVAVSFGTPEESAGRIALPVRIAGADQIGGAMLTLEAPLDRYDVIGFDVRPLGDWLTLHEVRDGRIVLGLIDVQDRRQLDLRVSSSFTLTLALRPGQPPGGDVTAVAGEFSGPDGVTLGVDLGRPSQPLPGVSQVSLGANQPNPFSTETAFTLDLATAADVVIGIYDLRGRAVANLHRAPLGSGPHVFRWDGRRADGSTAPNGVYFYKATVGGRSLARKLILMRGD